MIYGIVGAMVGEYLFFWMVVGKGDDLLTSFATTVLGSITVVGVARLIAARWRVAQSYKNGG
jgi:uncharacterized membrane protein YeaQ/YmgE (transglycosylase-associated protein family)